MRVVRHAAATARAPRRARALAAALLAGALAVVPAFAAHAADPGGGVSAASVGDDGRVHVVVVAPITVPTGDGGLLDADRLTKLTSPTGLLTQELDAVSGTSVALAIDPRIIASIRVLGTAAPTTARAWLARLQQLDNESFPLAYADADPVAAGQAGQTIATTPTSFDFAIDEDHFGPAATASPSPSASASPSPNQEPALPTTPAEVLKWDWTYPNLSWPAADTVVTADVPRLASAGVGTVLLSDTNTTGSEGHVILSGDGVPRTITGLVTDSALSSAGAAVADASGQFAAESAAGDVTAALQSAAADTRGSIRVLTLSRSSPGSLSHLDLLLSTIAATATPTTLSAALHATAGSASIVDKPESADRLAAVTRIASALGTAATYSSVAVDPTALIAPRQLDADALLGTGWIGDDGFAASLKSFLAEAEKVSTGVSLVVSQGTALGANPLLPVTVRNSLDVPIVVEVLTRSRGLNLSIPADKRRIEITVQPQSTQIVRVPTQSVSNGKARVQVNLVTSTGVELAGPVQLTLDVQAGWETAGTLVAVVLVLGVFGFGVTRRILRRRRGDADPDAADADADPAVHAAADDAASPDAPADPERSA